MDKRLLTLEQDMPRVTGWQPGPDSRSPREQETKDLGSRVQALGHGSSRLVVGTLTLPSVFASPPALPPESATGLVLSPTPHTAPSYASCFGAPPVLYLECVTAGTPSCPLSVFTLT